MPRPNIVLIITHGHWNELLLSGSWKGDLLLLLNALVCLWLLLWLGDYLLDLWQHRTG